MSASARYAIITPYYKEDRSLIERCITSVRNQSIRADHFVIADGFSQAWIDDAGVRHFKLDRNHGDFGNTPRGVGALIAIGEEYSAIGLLDADNWLEPNHIEACLAAAHTSPTPCDYVIARRTLRRLDETIIPLPENPLFIDTNCFFFLRGSFSVTPYWATMPKRLAPLSDQYFTQMIRRLPYTYASVSRPTVNYHCLWEVVYHWIGETPPPEAKPNIDEVAKVDNWLRSLDRRELEIASRLTGVQLQLFAGPPAPTERMERENRGLPDCSNVSRNAKCPCGSGKKFKHCHGALA
jgi:hypothetical protein